MEQTTRDILNIVKSGILGIKTPVSHDFDALNVVDTVYKHKITNIFFNGLTLCGVKISPEVNDFFMKALFFELSADASQQSIISEITSIFNENAVSHMLLKGSIMKKLYPKPEMRRMGDIDILIKQDEYKLIKKLLLEEGYEEKGESDHEFKWTKNGVLVELHKRLVSTVNEDLYSYYGDWFANAVPEEKYSYKMTDEDFLIYLIVHFAKHYRKTGIGIIHMCDLYIFLKNRDIDKSYLKTELKKLQLYKFYKNIVSTLEVWFEDAPQSEMTDHITSVIMASGVYGTHENEILSYALRKKTKYKYSAIGKVSRALAMLFPPRSTLKNKYKVLNKIPVLLPVIWIVRAFELVFFRKGDIKRGVGNFNYADNEKIENYRIQLEYVGLKMDLNKKTD